MELSVADTSFFLISLERERERGGGGGINLAIFEDKRSDAHSATWLASAWLPWVLAHCVSDMMLEFS